ncbi:MAG: zinc ribbon domain-containing protein [Gammaproteobacteria bacterium]|nr:zinc ribbon domain-containing protein [Gammaproteobacteria bacterium]
MPIFDYQCEACGHHFDVLQKVGEGPLRKCPECGKLKLKKQMAAPNFHLKGSGWYKTDFKDKSAKKDASKAEARADPKAPEKAGHTLDSGPAHTHDASCGHNQGSSSGSHSHGGHTHSHGGHSHSHGPGGHKH